MSGEREPEAPARAIGGELVIPALALGFTVYYFYSILDAPWTAKVSTYFVGSILIGLVSIFVIVRLRAVWRREASLGAGALASPASMAPRRLGLLALTAGYIFVLQWGGFTLTTAVFLYAGIMLLGGRDVHRKALLIATIVPLIGYVLFIVVFQTRFPEGPFESLLGGLF